MRRSSPNNRNRRAHRSKLHFDIPPSAAERASFAPEPQEAARHAFLPFIALNLAQVQAELQADQTWQTGIKYRTVMSAAHRDGLLYAYYQRLLAPLYEARLSKYELQKEVLAFRPLTTPSGRRATNIDFAGEMFEQVRNYGPCTVLSLDISKFYNNLDHALLKQSWADLLERNSLPDDHYALYRSLTRFAYVEQQQLQNIPALRRTPERYSLCTPQQFDRLIRRAGLIRINSQPCGIPQGVNLSNLLSNIYMLEIDRRIKQLLEQVSAGRPVVYRRFCDDMTMIIPAESGAAVSRQVEKILKEYKLPVNREKTAQTLFTAAGDGIIADRPLQFLGFTFDGRKTLIRKATFDRFVFKMKTGVEQAVTAYNIRRFRGLQRRFSRKPLYRKYSYLGRRNFIAYAFRAARILNAPGIRAQVKPLWKQLQLLLDQQGTLKAGISYREFLFEQSREEANRIRLLLEQPVKSAEEDPDLTGINF